MENKTINKEDVKGWGIDRNPENDPTYPIRKRIGEESRKYDWVRPPQQQTNIEVLQSVERPEITAVFGASSPPKGLSGAIRRWAFKRGEGDFGHWIPLILADRVNAMEGILEDLRQGHLPNVFAEKGFNAQWKYNRKGVIKKLAITALFTGVAFAVAFKRAGKFNVR